MRGPLAIGIHVSHDASVAVCSPDGVIFSVAEERLTRLKHHHGFPRRALDLALQWCGLTAGDIDALAFSTSSIIYPQHGNGHIVQPDGTSVRAPAAANSSAAGEAPPGISARARRWVAAGREDPVGAAARALRLLARMGRPALPTPEEEERTLEFTREFADRHWSRHGGFLAEKGFGEERLPYYYIAHHRAHAASAFRLSGVEDACVLTADGKGDGLSAAIYHGRSDGRMDLVRATPAQDSLGSFYQAVTEALGFVPVDSEYKTMGLAAFGRGAPDDNPFKDLVQVRDGRFVSREKWRFRSFNAANPEKRVDNPLASVVQADRFRRILAGFSREDFSYFAQELCESAMVAFAGDGMRLTKSRRLACAGGVMLNVKANALVRDTLRPEEHFVFPDSGDSGLAAGAAMEALHQLGALGAPAAFGSPFLGHGFSDAAARAEVERFAGQHALRIVEASADDIASQLTQGKVIGTFQGRLEMGPRALGNRSVLADPRSESVKDRINLLLKGREPFVPFAPAVLEEDAHLYWDGTTDYRYMTFAVAASERARQTVPAVVHADGTMRPEVVSASFNDWLYEVLQAFKQRTGVGVLLNTSFNRHGLPIVGSPRDALEHLVNGWIDGLSIGTLYVERG